MLLTKLQRTEFGNNYDNYADLFIHKRVLPKVSHFGDSRFRKVWNSLNNRQCHWRSSVKSQTFLPNLHVGI